MKLMSAALLAKCMCTAVQSLFTLELKCGLSIPKCTFVTMGAYDVLIGDLTNK